MASTRPLEALESCRRAAAEEFLLLLDLGAATKFTVEFGVLGDVEPGLAEVSRSSPRGVLCKEEMPPFPGN